MGNTPTATVPRRSAGELGEVGLGGAEPAQDVAGVARPGRVRRRSASARGRAGASSGCPASHSSRRSCCETADGV